jgi:Ca2+-binding RTX toxin-like protein
MRIRAILLLATTMATLILASGLGLAVTEVGTNGDNIILGTRKGDYLRGGDGNDWLNGFRGQDFLYGDAGNDTLFDGPIKERAWDGLKGGAGNDILVSYNKPGWEDNAVCGSGFDRAYVDRSDLVGFPVGEPPHRAIGQPPIKGDCEKIFHRLPRDSELPHPSR